MNELDAIVKAWKAGPEATCGAVLTTVVHVKGSAYRRPGARMLILADGTRIGTVSGGCLENDVSKKAWWFTESGEAVVRVYDTTSGEDAVWEFGLGCSGFVHVLFERLDRADTQEMLRFLDANRAARRGVVVATVIGANDGGGARVGDRLLVDNAGVCGGGLADSALAAEVLSHAREAYVTQKSCLLHVASCDVFVEWCGPPLALVIFGAGHDAIPLVRVAKEMGWHVTVADGRPAYANARRFPEADCVVLLNRSDLLAGISIARGSAVVMMTHNYAIDEQLLKRILPAKPRYLGLLGPHSRADKLFAEWGQPAHGIDVHAPVGLDLGGDTPESIALAIAAEIQASFAGRFGGMLKYRHGAIHNRAGETGTRAGAVREVSETAVCELA